MDNLQPQGEPQIRRCDSTADAVQDEYFVVITVVSNLNVNVETGEGLTCGMLGPYWW